RSYGDWSSDVCSSDLMVALGSEHAGLFANDDRLADRLTAAGKAVGEKLWRLPLSDAYDRAIDSDAADVKNIAGDRGAGSIIGAQIGRASCREREESAG